MKIGAELTSGQLQEGLYKTRKGSSSSYCPKGRGKSNDVSKENLSEHQKGLGGAC